MLSMLPANSHASTLTTFLFNVTHLFYNHIINYLRKFFLLSNPKVNPQIQIFLSDTKQKYLFSVIKLFAKTLIFHTQHDIPNHILLLINYENISTYHVQISESL